MYIQYKLSKKKKILNPYSDQVTIIQYNEQKTYYWTILSMFLIKPHFLIEWNGMWNSAAKGQALEPRESLRDFSIEGSVAYEPPSIP